MLSELVLFIIQHYDYIFGLCFEECCERFTFVYYGSIGAHDYLYNEIKITNYELFP